MSIFNQITSNTSPALYAVIKEKVNIIIGQTLVEFCMNFKIKQNIEHHEDGSSSSSYEFYQMVDTITIPNFMRPLFMSTLDSLYNNIKEDIEEKIDSANIPIQ